MENRRTALITGGSVYLGSHLSKALKADGWNVVIYDKVYPKHKYCDLYSCGDIRDRRELTVLFDKIKFDTVFHLAGRIEVGESNLHPTEFCDVNVGGTATLLNIMNYWGVKNIVFSSTAGVYVPNNKPLNENSEIAGNSVYASTKIACENMIKDSGFNYIIFRYFNLAGADPKAEIGENHSPETHLIPRILQNLNNVTINGNDYSTPDGSCIRDYVHVCDVADAHVKAAYHLLNKNGSQILNLGTGQGHSIFEIIKLVEEITKQKVEYTVLPRREGDGDCLIADASLAKSILSFNPKYDINEIIKTAYRWEKTRKTYDKV